MRLHKHFLLSSIIALVHWTHFALAQDDPSSSNSAPSCTFFCPPENLVSWKLAKRPFAIGFDSFYTIFECIAQMFCFHRYATTQPAAHDLVSERKCSYNKHTGSQALEAAGDNCPPQAIPCPEPPSTDSDSQSTDTHPTPVFSHIDGEEIVPWVEGGRYLLYLSEHPPS